MTLLIMVGLGGALGAYARYRVTAWVHGWTRINFPWGTLSVNLSGSFLLGLVLPRLELADPIPAASALVTVGCLGAFTTFSTFALEAVRLIETGYPWRAVGYIAASLGLGLAAIAAGLMLGGAFAR